MEYKGRSKCNDVGYFSTLIFSTMRIALFFFITFSSIHIGYNALATVNQLQEQRAEQYCQVNSEYCK